MIRQGRLCEGFVQRCLICAGYVSIQEYQDGLSPTPFKLTSERAAYKRASRRDNMKKEIEGYAIVLT
ncbi:MAG: hypothetical protein CM15mV131_500 [uncultured marine virus]|nr:MAG: hypothetical protein CM15mV131_500 [uncultured marine virus]